MKVELIRVMSPALAHHRRTQRANLTRVSTGAQVTLLACSTFAEQGCSFVRPLRVGGQVGWILPR